MTTHSPADRYDYCTNVMATIFGLRDQRVVLFADFECEVEITTELSADGFDLSAHCSNVFVDSLSLRTGDDLAKHIHSFIQAEVDAALEARSGIWDEVVAREGLSLSGHAGDPDSRWMQAAE